MLFDVFCLLLVGCCVLWLVVIVICRLWFIDSCFVFSVGCALIVAFLKSCVLVVGRWGVVVGCWLMFGVCRLMLFGSC